MRDNEDENMIGTRNQLVLLGIGGIALLGTSACNLSFDLETEGSGVAETVTFDFDSFDEVDISGAFNADITIVEGPPSVEITIDDNLVDRLEVEVDDGELNVGLEFGSVSYRVEPTVVVTMPSLRGLDVSGASTAEVKDLDETTLKVQFSGASDADIQGEVAELQLDGSGAGNLRIDGTIGAVEMDLSGASSADFTDAVVQSAKVDLSGGSEAEFEDLAEASGDLSGGSSMLVPDGTAVSVSTSGGADVDRS